MATHPDPTVTLDPKRGPPPAGTPVASDPAPERPGRGPAPVEVVHGSGPHLTSETDALRQVRLRAAALFFLAVVAIALVRDQLARDYALRPLQLAVLTAMAAAAALLSGRVPLPARGLAMVEYGTFGLMACDLAVLQYHATLWAAENKYAGAVPVAAEAAVARSILLMVAYGMLIPNPWRRAARVVLAIAAVPIATEAVLLLARPELPRADSTAELVDRISGSLLLLSAGAGLAIYGPFVFGSLRRAAFEARRLNQYRLVRPLGVGGMGEVYLAEHSLLRRPCALKLIKPERADDAVMLGRFEREVRATARLSHPNVIEVFDFGRTAEGTFYYVMEYLPGLTLEDLVGRHGPLPAGRVIYLLRQACAALAEAHAAGLVHRDIKPANLFAARRGRRHDLVKVLDFGLVLPTAVPEARGLTLEGRILGTPTFMAPEQVRGVKALDGRCDLYALGGVAYNLLTGRPPFEGAGTAEVLIAQVRDPVVPPSRVWPAVPPDVERVVLRCLAKDPSDRYPDGESLDAALAECTAAGDWDDRKAAQWWQEFEPEAVVDAEAMPA